MIIVIGPKDRNNAIGEIINTTSSSNTWSKGLSPFFLGPVYLYQNFVAKNVENAWQFSKVYKTHLDENENPSTDYFIWAQNGWNSSWGIRYPMGKGKVPEYSFWNGEKLNYIEARKRIYIPLYASAVKNSQAFLQLEEIYLKNKVLTLFDFDGYYVQVNSIDDLIKIVNDPHKKMGHAFVLSMLLLLGKDFNPEIFK